MAARANAGRVGDFHVAGPSRLPRTKWIKSHRANAGLPRRKTVNRARGRDPAAGATTGASVSPSAASSAPVHEAVLSELRPTQMTVGYAEVALKRQQWQALSHRDRSEFLQRHVVPGVLGPKGRRFIIDHHHLARALFDEHVEHLPFSVLADFSSLDKSEFWAVMDYRQWVHPYDAQGRKHPCRDLPKSVAGLQDDPYRSLAAALRIVGELPKEQTPFAEFLWADYFRRRVPAALLARDPDAALAKALALTHDESARHLPGWTASRSPTNDRF